LVATDKEWVVSRAESPAAAGAGKPAQVLGDAQMSPWQLQAPVVQTPLYADYDLTAAVLCELGVVEDFASAGPVRYTHRHTSDREIYFLANRSDQPIETSATFRVGEGAPELWDPINGDLRVLPQFNRTGRRIEVPLRFEPFESYFVVFPARSKAAAGLPSRGSRNFAEFTELQRLQRSWEVSFDDSMGAPERVRFDELADWTRRPEPGVKHYSGIATYRTTFDLNESQVSDGGSLVFLDLGGVQVMARVRLNGKDCGVVWTAPWRVDIGHAIQAAGNVLEIEVANLWPNRMIGDAASPDRKFTQTTYRPYQASDPLLPSGLLGPVRVLKSSLP
jgi:hypothetical protein